MCIAFVNHVYDVSHEEDYDPLRVTPTLWNIFLGSRPQINRLPNVLAHAPKMADTIPLDFSL